MQRIESKAAAFLYHVNHINSYTGDLITNISSKLEKKMKTFIYLQPNEAKHNERDDIRYMVFPSKIL